MKTEITALVHLKAGYAVCPDCHGDGCSPYHHHQRCLSCKDTPGQVRQDRVCPTCHHWLANCKCRPVTDAVSDEIRRALALDRTPWKRSAK